MKKFIFLFFCFITFIYASNINEIEPNNTWRDATQININDIGIGNLNGLNDDTDWWKFTPTKSGILTIYTTGASKDIDAELYGIKLIDVDYKANNNIYMQIFVQANKTYYLLLFLNQLGTTSYNLHFSFFPTKNTATFHHIFNENLNGKLNVIGNHNICYTNGTNQCLNPGNADNNNIIQNYINIDQNAIDNGYINSSEADLNLTTGDNIVKAYLFWQGRIRTNDPINDNAIKNANKVEFKTPTTNDYVTIDANQSSFNWYYGSDGVFDYGAYADVTQYVQKSGQYYVANLQVSQGYNTGGGWSLVVITQNPKDKFKKIVVYHGFQAIYNAEGYPPFVTQTLKNFYTPVNGPVNASFILFANETDKDLDDNITLTDKNGNLHYLSNSLNPLNNVLNCTISKFGQNVIDREPNFSNTLGTDIDEFNVSDIFDNSQTETNITINSNGDRVFLEMFGVSIQLYVPKVCYYDFNLYDENGNPITSDSKLYTGDKIKISFKIKNDENETAKNVQFIYPFDENNLTEYIPNSTEVKNVLETNSTHIDDNSHIGDLGVYVDNNALKIGILGDNDKNFLPYDTNNNYIAGIEFNTTLQHEGNLSFNFYIDYNYSIGDQNFTYNDILPKCSEFENNYNIYHPVIGAFNVVETSFNSNTDPIDVNNSLNAIHTKIVDQNFLMKVIHLGEDNETLQNYDGNVTVKLINAENNSTLWTSPVIEFHNETNKTFDVNFTGNLLHRAVQKAAFRIFYKQDDKNISVDSRNQFAIRPYNFEIDTSNLPSEIKAGEDFNLTLKALSKTGNPVLDYNETINIGSGDSPLLEYNDTNASKGCITGILSGKNLTFRNGEANVTLNYSEVGDLNITIKEINGSEFAKVDENDTLDDINRIIEQNSTVITFIPYDFNISASYKNFNDLNFTYISSDLNMSSVLDVNITAENEQNQTTKNYNEECYAKNFDLNVSYQIPAQISNKIKKILIKEANETNETNVSLPNIIIKNFPKTYFATDNNGTARLILHINFEKNYTNPVNEFNFTIKDINISDEDNVTGTKPLEQNATFKYGRIDVQNVSGYGNEVNTTFQYEYWTDKDGWVVNKEHNSSIFGDVNKSSAYQSFVSKQFDVNMNVHNIVNGEENVTISTTRAIPYSTKIHLSIPSWLWYYPLAKDYKNPSATNLDCLTHPCFDVDFQKQSSGWGGVGTDEGNYTAEKRTAEINASTSKIKANKSEVKKLNW